MQVVRDPGPLTGQGQLAAALVEAGVGQRDRGVRGQDPQQPLVVVGEATGLVGQEDRAEDLVVVDDRHPEEVGQLGVRLGPALEGGCLADVGEPGGRRVVQHRGEHAVLARQRPDRLPLLVAHPVHHELGEPAVVVGDPEGGVLRAQQRAGGGGDAAQHLAHLEVGAHRDDGFADGFEAVEAAVVERAGAGQAVFGGRVVRSPHAAHATAVACREPGAGDGAGVGREA